MRRLVCLDSALDGLDAIFRHAVDVGSHIAQGASPTDPLRDQCPVLARLPGVLGRSRATLLAGLRSFPVGSHPIFRYEADTLIIIDILHASRDIDTFCVEDP